MKEPGRGEDVQAPRRRTNWPIIALIAGAIFLVLVLAYFMRTGDPDQDKLTNAEIAATTLPPSREKLCSKGATYNLIKQTLFEHAAALRGTDQSAFARLAGYAVVRMDNPVMESQDNASGAVNCSGSLSIDLPPGVAVNGGAHSLMSNVDYTVSAAADGSAPTVALHGADAIISSLASLTLVNAAPGQAPDIVTGNDSGPEMNVAQSEPQRIVPQPPPTPAPQARADSPRPSFDCNAARSSGAQIVCSDVALAALDRRMASDYSQALATAPPDERDLLRDTGRRFTDFRDHCDTRICVQDAYSGRIREIRDILEGRWQSR